MITGKIEGYLIALAAIAIVAYAVYHKGVIDERDRWELRQAAATKADLGELRDSVVASNKIAADTAALLAKRKANTIIDRGIIQNEIKTNTVYSADCFPPSGLRMWNDLSAGRTVVPGGAAGRTSGDAVSTRNGAAVTGR